MLGGAVRLVAVAGPVAAGLGVAVLLGRMLQRPDGLPATLAWGLLVALAVLATSLGVSAVTRRLLPLAALLELSLAFPGRAPQRLHVARVAGSRVELARRLEAARRGGTGDERPLHEVLELTVALTVHDRRTRGHSERVRLVTDAIAMQLHIGDDDRARLRWASLLHDIGKLEVPGSVLNRPGKLRPRDWHLVRTHPAEGARLIAPLAGWLGDWSRAVPEHHERWDGSGYPASLSGSAISLGGRIVAVADAYEVMTSARPYRRPLGVAAARHELVRCAGTEFDPAVVRALLRLSTRRLWWTAGLATGLLQLPGAWLLASLPARLGAPGRAALATATAAGGVALAGAAAAPLTASAPVAEATVPPASDTGLPAPTRSAGTPPPRAAPGVPPIQPRPSQAVLGMSANAPPGPPTPLLTAAPAGTPAPRRPRCGSRHPRPLRHQPRPRRRPPGPRRRGWRSI